MLAGAILLFALPKGGTAAGPSLPLTRDDLSPADRARVQAVTAPATDFSQAEPFENLPGGAATTRKRVNADVFSQFSANLSFEEQSAFQLGNALFRKMWVSSPASSQASDGLGPLFNARACQSCHIKDGRGHPPEGSDDATSFLLWLARAPRDAAETAALAGKRQLVLPDPVYGAQLQDLAVPGLLAEGDLTVTYAERRVWLGDGAVVSLRAPRYGVGALTQGPLDPLTTLSPRVAPPMIGLGLVEAIHPADIGALADPEDGNGDGISGKASVMHDPQTGQPLLGRFGWKASTPTILRQSAEAFAIDMGLSTPLAPLHRGDCTEAQTACAAAATGVQARLGDTEAPDPVLDLVSFYSRNLAVPARRGAENPEILRGKSHFYALGCASCHTPKFVTRRDSIEPAQSFQLIWPYSDFLLHDMGEGLSDGQAVGDATGREWRTPPLWGLGLTQTVNGHTFFLHDGRARNLTDAILWHGGEAKAARDGFAALPAPARDALIRFVESL